MRHMNLQTTPKVSGYAAPSGSSHSSTKIPRLTPRTPRDDEKSSSSTSKPRPSKLPTPRSSALQKPASPRLAHDTELKSVGKPKYSTIPKLITAKQHASPRYVISPRTLRTPSKLPQKHVRPTEIKPGAYPRQEKLTDNESSGQSEAEQSSTHENEDLTKFADDSLENSSCDENLVQPLCEQLPPVAEFHDNDRSSESLCSSHENLENEQDSMKAVTINAAENKENVHPIVPPLPLHLLDDTDNTADATSESSLRENIITEGLEEEKGQLQNDMQSLKERLDRIREEALQPQKQPGNDKMTQELEGLHT